MYPSARRACESPDQMEGIGMGIVSNVTAEGSQIRIYKVIRVRVRSTYFIWEDTKGFRIGNRFDRAP